MCRSFGLPRTPSSLTALGLSLVALASLPACDLNLDKMFAQPPPDCAAAARGPWVVGRSGGEIQLHVGESHHESVTPGLPAECGDRLISVTWSVADPSVASVVPPESRNARQDTAADISRAWITGLAPGLTTVNARVQFADSVWEARAEGLRVVPPEASARGSVILAQDTVALTFNRWTGAAGSDLIPITVPRAGRIDISVDWTSFANNMGLFLWEGTCVDKSCPGRLVVDGQLGDTKPHRESVKVARGDYTLEIFGFGSGQDAARYEVRLTPD